MAKLSPPMRDLDRLGKTAQPQHRNHAEQGPGRENHERIAPANQIDEARDQLNRDRRQKKSEARLDRQRRADVLWIPKLGHTGRKLG